MNTWRNHHLLLKFSIWIEQGEYNWSLNFCYSNLKGLCDNAWWCEDDLSLEQRENQTIRANTFFQLNNAWHNQRKENQNNLTQKKKLRLWVEKEQQESSCSCVRCIVNLGAVSPQVHLCVPPPPPHWNNQVAPLFLLVYCQHHVLFSAPQTKQSVASGTWGTCWKGLSLDCGRT